MKYLLDIHTLIWFLNDNKLLSKSAKKAIKPLNTTCFFSIASLWEMSIKLKLDKLYLSIPFDKIEKSLTDNNIQILSLTFEDTLNLISLPLHHKDPFDRIIISQAINNKLTIITKDVAFALYEAETLW